MFSLNYAVKLMDNFFFQFFSKFYEDKQKYYWYYEHENIKYSYKILKILLTSKRKKSDSLISFILIYYLWWDNLNLPSFDFNNLMHSRLIHRAVKSFHSISSLRIKNYKKKTLLNPRSTVTKLKRNNAMKGKITQRGD